MKQCIYGIYIQWNISQPEKKNEILAHGTAQVTLENIMLSEIWHMQNKKYRMIPLL